jgi:predicted alpha/beta-hydrolase family hydrolase
MSKGFICLSHGLESGPDAAKVTALAEVGEALGFECERPDFRAFDARGMATSVELRVQHIETRCKGRSRVVLAGSSLGAFSSALASARMDCAGLFLIAPPLLIPGHDQHLCHRAAQVEAFHGWGDELIAAQYVVDYCAAHRIRLTLVDGDHRLGDHVPDIARAFGAFLERLG